MSKAKKAKAAPAAPESRSLVDCAVNDQRLPDRFWAKVAVDDASGCWNWVGSRSRGYGHFAKGRSPDGHSVMCRAHRVAYEALAGAIPEGLQLDHLCRNRSCVNPAHLEPVTPRENTRRGGVREALARRAEARTACPSGHPFDEANTRITPEGHRSCRACHRARVSAAYWARKAAR